MKASRWLGMLCLCALATPARTAVLSTPVCAADAVSLTPQTRIAWDRNGSLTPDEVLRLPPARLQSAASAEAPDYDDTWWLRIDLRNDTNTACQRWLLVGPARQRDVRVYVRRDGGWIDMRSGSDYPFREWTVPERRPVFPLALAPHATTTVLMHVDDPGGPVVIAPELWNDDQFRRSEVRRSLFDGLVYGGMLVLVLTSLVLGCIHRRPLLLAMALTALFYTCYVIVLDNYAFVYLWPDSPRLNLWVRYLCINLTYAAAFRYFSGAMRVRKLGRFWSWPFVAAQGGFVALALVGGLLRDSAAVTGTMLVLDQICRLLLVVAGVLGLFRRDMRSWYTPVLIAWLVGQEILLYGDDLGAPVTVDQMYAVTVLSGGVLLLGTLIDQVRRGRRREMHARAELDRQAASERERLERNVALRTAELDRALQARRLLLARISHDLRSPLAGILDSARQWQAGETRRDYPHLIERHARQQMELIDELLEFSREELSDLELQAVPGYLHAFLDEVAEQAELSAERNGNRLVREFAHGLPALVRADFRRLRQVLANLLGNAAKFTRGGRIRFAVACAAPVAAGRARLRFTVQDDGIGIAPDERERLLLPFIRGGNASRHEGSGLGLAIVARLLDHMDSRLDIDAPPGGGSRFGFELELPLADEGELEPVLDEGGPVAVDGDGRVILVVDDQPQQREVTCDLLDGCGFETLAAADGGEALRLLRQRPVDLVLTDQYMGDTDGWTLLHAVRQERPDLPVLLYSALPPQRPVGMAADFTSALLKPASGRQLLARVDACLRSHPGTAPVEGG